MVIGGPPCQGFSLARGLRFVDDPRNHLYKEFIRMVDQFQPKWIVMENVQGITNIGKGIVLGHILEDFNRIGYWVDCKVINMAQFGVPQTRKRAIFVGSREAASFKWPETTHQKAKITDQLGLLDDVPPFVSVGQALGDLPWPMGDYFSHRANSQMRGPRNRLVDSDPAFTLRVRGDEFALRSTPADGVFSPGPTPEVKLGYYPTTHPYQELMREPPPEWISDLNGYKTKRGKQPKLEGTRRLSVREQARLQSFPDWFEFTGTDYAKGRQVGNAVPPLFAKQLFAEIFTQGFLTP